MHSVNQIRTSFLEFFKRHGHQVVQSAPLVPHNDPTLMFTNAGMVPFKNVFTGAEKRPYSRAASSQKCVRAGGKHNDLDNVGYTARHHTFFEMLGNFSFGNYFKEEAIPFAWEFLTKDLGLPKEKLYITIYHTDDEAFNIWKKVTSFSDDRILRIPTSDNFWAMGDTGPCGPCSEIFYDHGPEIPGGLPGTPEEDGDRYIEIWNLVFMQYESLASGERINLPKPSIDTGMGLERISAVLQGVHNNYEIDLFSNLIEASQDISGNNNPDHLVSHRVLADHLRSSCFLVADGVLPSNEGRGYVLRRIMRRAMRHAHQLGCKDPLMYRLVPALVEQMGGAFPELERGQAMITEVLKLEEERFKEMLDRGLKLLDQEAGHLSKGAKLAGNVAFKLYDTYGFPLDLTKDILRGRHIEVDESGFDTAMAEQKARAKAAWKGSGEKATDEIWFDIKNTHGATDFLGYDLTNAEAKVVALVVDGQQVQSVTAGQNVVVILNQTPYYGESGGQMGDTGTIEKQGTTLRVTDTQKALGELHLHIAHVESGSLSVGDEVSASVDAVHRDKLRANHSATHLLHAVLRKHLGKHVAQKGSLVAEERLRFDISQPRPITAEELEFVEAEVNRLIRLNTPVTTHVMTPEQALKHGALALFGEKYGEQVRVVEMGLGEERGYSIEFCGGTHVRRTGDIACFVIVNEAAIASGVRRIEALTGEAAFNYLRNRDRLLSGIASRLKVIPEEVAGRVESLLEERKKLEKELSETRKAAVMGSGGGDAPTETINGITFLGKALDGIPPKELRDIADNLKKQVGSGIVTVACAFEGKASLIVCVTPDLTGKISAVDLVRVGTEAMGGKGGGGRPEMAQSGGPDGSKAPDAIQAIKAALAG